MRVSSDNVLYLCQFFQFDVLEDYYIWLCLQYVVVYRFGWDGTKPPSSGLKHIQLEYRVYKPFLETGLLCFDAAWEVGLFRAPGVTLAILVIIFKDILPGLRWLNYSHCTLNSRLRLNVTATITTSPIGLARGVFPVYGTSTYTALTACGVDYFWRAGPVLIQVLLSTPHLPGNGRNRYLPSLTTFKPQLQHSSQTPSSKFN